MVRFAEIRTFRFRKPLPSFSDYILRNICFIKSDILLTQTKPCFKFIADLAVVLALFAIKPVGWVMSFSPDSRLTMKALEMSWETRGKPVGLMFHSD